MTHVVNVASVPQRSPFRYPGGKTWLIPHVRAWLRSLPKRPACLVEPFAGGGTVSLTVASEKLADRALMVELDREIASVWQVISDGLGPELADKIERFQLSADSARAELSRTDGGLLEIAFRTLLKNRTYHGGIMARGSSMMRNGENGKGITSRWYPQTLKKRILQIDYVRERVEFVCGDGLAVLEQHARNKQHVFFIDPPYTAAGKRAGKRLYTHNELDHERLFALTSRLQGDFLMTYDNAEGVRSLASRHGFDMEAVAMKNTHHAEMTELLIGRNLSWARSLRGSDAQRSLF